MWSEKPDFWEGIPSLDEKELVKELPEGFENLGFFEQWDWQLLKALTSDGEIVMFVVDPQRGSLLRSRDARGEWELIYIKMEDFWRFLYKVFEKDFVLWRWVDSGSVYLLEQEWRQESRKIVPYLFHYGKPKYSLGYEESAFSRTSYHWDEVSVRYFELVDEEWQDLLNALQEFLNQASHFLSWKESFWDRWKDWLEYPERLEKLLNAWNKLVPLLQREINYWGHLEDSLFLSQLEGLLEKWKNIELSEKLELLYALIRWLRESTLIKDVEKWRGFESESTIWDDLESAIRSLKNSIEGADEWEKWDTIYVKNAREKLEEFLKKIPSVIEKEIEENIKMLQQVLQNQLEPQDKERLEADIKQLEAQKASLQKAQQQVKGIIAHLPGYPKDQEEEPDRRDFDPQKEQVEEDVAENPENIPVPIVEEIQKMLSTLEEIGNIHKSAIIWDEEKDKEYIATFEGFLEELQELIEYGKEIFFKLHRLSVLPWFQVCVENEKGKNCVDIKWPRMQKVEAPDDNSFNPEKVWSIGAPVIRGLNSPIEVLSINVWLSRWVGAKIWEDGPNLLIIPAEAKVDPALKWMLYVLENNSTSPTNNKEIISYLKRNIKEKEAQLQECVLDKEKDRLRRSIEHDRKQLRRKEGIPLPLIEAVYPGVEVRGNISIFNPNVVAWVVDEDGEEIFFKVKWPSLWRHFNDLKKFADNLVVREHKRNRERRIKVAFYDFMISFDLEGNPLEIYDLKRQRWSKLEKWKRFLVQFDQWNHKGILYVDWDWFLVFEPIDLKTTKGLKKLYSTQIWGVLED